MQLGGTGIRGAFETKAWTAYEGERELDIEDLTIGPNSIDVTLHPKVLIPAAPIDGVVDPYNADSLMWTETEIPETGIVLAPGAAYLGAVNERFDCREPLILDGVGRLFKPDIDGRSSVGRMFVSVHITAGYGDYGFEGAFTLEIRNDFSLPVRLYPGMRIAQVFFTEVSAPDQYEGAYSKSCHFDGPRPPVLGRNRF